MIPFPGSYVPSDASVLLDVSSLCDKSGYAIRGERPFYLHRGQRVSAIAALCTEGIVAVELTFKFFDC